MWSIEPIHNTFTLITAISGILAAAIGFQLKVVVPCVRGIQRLTEMGPIIDRILAELTPNGGGSIKDRIRRIDESIAVIEHRYRWVQDCSLVAIYECSADGQATFCNAALCNLFGMPHESMLGTGWLAALVDEDRQSTWETWISSTEAGIPYSHSYEIINQRTGERIKVRTKAVAIKMRTGEIASYHGTIWRCDQ